MLSIAFVRLKKKLPDQYIPIHFKQAKLHT
jgi:hypothetical protein